MTAPTMDERRAVARRLRGYDCPVLPSQQTTMEAVDAAVGCMGLEEGEEVCTVRQFLDRLADLIDPGEGMDEDGRAALDWVRGHGGIDEVEAEWGYAHDRTGLANSVAVRLGVDPLTDADISEKVMGELDRRLMPESMEWPRYEDCELVQIGDEFMGKDGKTYTAKQIQFIGKCFSLYDFCDRKPQFDGFYGERVKRPAPKVLDSEGVECNIGDAVWWVHNKTGNFRIIRIEQDGKCAIHDDDADEPCGMTVPSTELTHKRPVLDADGVEIREGDTVYYVDGREQRVNTVARLTDDGCVQFGTINEAGYVTYCEGACIQPNLLTHRAPVLAADGKPLRVGETVWYANGDGLQLTVVRVEGDRVVTTSARDGEQWWAAYILTHEQPDSWERLEDDATQHPWYYCKQHGVDTDAASPDADLAEERRALAERGQ